jgi:dipeptidyl aminopeptidase/acylaminoacyl peptidase
MRNTLTGAILAAATLLVSGASAVVAATGNDDAPVAAAADGATTRIPLETFLRRPTFVSMKISPDGRHLAATVPHGDDKTVLVVLDRVEVKPTALLELRGREHVSGFSWVSDERLIVAVAKKEGMLDQPIPTGELYGMDADGKRTRVLFGYRAGSAVQSRVARAAAEYASASLLHVFPDDDDHVLISVNPWLGGERGRTEVRRMDVETGTTRLVARAPEPLAQLLVDPDGEVRLSFSTSFEGKQKVHRRSEGTDWQLINDEEKSGFAYWPLGYDQSGHLVVSRERGDGPDEVHRLDVDTGELTRVHQPDVDPELALPGRRHATIAGLQIHDGRPSSYMFDADSVEARLARALEGAFPGQYAFVTSYTRDGKLALVHVYSDRNSGEFYLLETETMKAQFLAASREWLDPAVMAEVRPVTFTARDGQRLHGYLTVPHGRDAKDLPMVVNPHGGPHGIRDYWRFNEEAQLLASRGYAVLQVNFRGSGGYGRSFERAGYREWGGLMQDDIADAVRWAIGEGYADADRICIYGASYGGYAALMNTVRYPDLYRCTIGYVGVYDLALMYNDGDIPQSMFGRNYLARVLGNERLAENSPVSHADRIKAPVLLIHGGEDVRVPQAHADRMRRALKDAGNDPEWLVERREGHGFYNMENRVRLYTQLLAFLDRHIGPAAARAASAPAARPAADVNTEAASAAAADPGT